MRARKIVLVARNELKRLGNIARGAIVATKKNSLSVAIASCDRWRGRIYDDLLLQSEFLRYGMGAKIVSWQDPTVEWKNFDAVVVGSMWGYQNYLEDFKKWLNKIGDETVLVNSSSVIQANYDKVKQFQVLSRVGIPLVETQVIKVGELEKSKLPEGEFVIKPAISGSGENTFLIKSSDDFKDIWGRLLRLNETKELLVQPFVPEIRNGELGVVVIGGEIVNVVRRFPGVVEGKYGVQLVMETEVPGDIKELVRRIVGLLEYREAVYLRVDVVEREDGPIVMEVEAFEPQLYYYLLKGKNRRKMLARMVTEVAKRARA